MLFGKDFQCPVCDYKPKDKVGLAEKIELLIKETPVFVFGDELIL